ELTDLIKDYKKKNAYTEALPDEMIKRIIDMKNENKRVSLQKIAEDVGVTPEKVRDTLIANDLWDFKTEASAKLKSIKNISSNSRALGMIENNGVIQDSYIFDAIVQKAIEDNIIYLGSAHTDEPVTADIRRLIRMPSSLHGGSGMRVVPLTLAGLSKFEPLNDAVVFSEKETKIDVLKPLKPQNSMVEMKGKSFTVTEGINTLPEYAAMYLMCRGAAEYA
ncbi:MAG: hypothetical protein O8C67_01625, partial [Candidatus Methanoperedens sp.]|nr:hypothetical protein [Candidatus Methanoperedens sp.]